MDEQQVVDGASEILSQVDWRKAEQLIDDPRPPAPQPDGHGCVLLPLGLLWIVALCAITVLTVLYAEKSRQLDAMEFHCNNLSAALSSLEGMFLGTVRDFGELQQKISNFSHNRSSATCSSCATGWRFHRGKCYFFSSSRMSWTRSRDFCTSVGGHLVIINSEAEQAFIRTSAAERLWTGLSSPEARDQWVWLDNMPMAVGAQFWFREAWRQLSGGSNGGGACASLDVALGWQRRHCSAVNKFVCEALAAS
ncbi:hepatic lectin-like isoform X1 [Arapaima gigas]